MLQLSIVLKHVTKIINSIVTESVYENADTNTLIFYLQLSDSNDICYYGFTNLDSGKCIRSILDAWSSLLLQKVAYAILFVILTLLFKIITHKYQTIINQCYVKLSMNPTYFNKIDGFSVYSNLLMNFGLIFCFYTFCF